MVDFSRDEARLGVVGAGAMGQGDVPGALEGGLAVVLHDARPGAAEDGAKRVFQRLERLVGKGRLERDRLAAMRGHLQIAPGLDGPNTVLNELSFSA